MRITNKLYAQHLGWHFKQLWQLKGKRVPYDTGAAAELEKLGVAVKDISEVLNPKDKHEYFEVVGIKPKPIREDETHPNWHSRHCHVYGDGNVLLEGMAQAQVLTKTVQIIGYPKNIEEYLGRLQLPNTIDRSIQKSIMASHVFDAEQVKLPKVKLPERPAYILPRAYGISHERRNRLLINKLIFECEKLAGRSVTSRRQLLDNADFNVTLLRGEDLLQFDISADKLITSVRPIAPVKSRHDGELPDLYPLKCTITIPKKHIYCTDDFVPLRPILSCPHPHTIFLHFNKEQVKNLHETPVTPTQFQSRTLLKAFTVAAAQAKLLYGEAASEKLPNPVVVQSIQTDGRSFHFGVFQLNTLSLADSGDLKNYWFHEPTMDLFESCGYEAGRPHLSGYNKDVFRRISAFYNNA